MLSGPIDIDKMDYLARDSLHAGVPYGRNFDQQRLIGSLCLNAAGDGLAITEKGKTAAEMMVFARYVMFSEVYWHHGVRAATAMLQRAFYLLHGMLDLDQLFRMSEVQFIDAVRQASGSSPAGRTAGRTVRPASRLYKRLAQYSILGAAGVVSAIGAAALSVADGLRQQFAQQASTALGRIVAPHEILFDAPPVECEVEFTIDVYSPKEDVYRSLEEVSPVVHTLARTQFDDYVKRVRIFAHPRIVDDLRRLEESARPAHRGDCQDGLSALAASQRSARRAPLLVRQAVLILGTALLGKLAVAPRAGFATACRSRSKSASC